MIQSNLIYLISILSYYLDNSNKKHLALLKTVFRYISETLDVELTFINNIANDLIRYTDTDFVEAIDSFKLINNYVFMLAEEYISHQIKC